MAPSPGAKESFVHAIFEGSHTSTGLHGQGVLGLGPAEALPVEDDLLLQGHRHGLRSRCHTTHMRIRTTKAEGGQAEALQALLTKARPDWNQHINLEVLFTL